MVVVCESCNMVVLLLQSGSTSLISIISGHLQDVKVYARGLGMKGRTGFAGADSALQGSDHHLSSLNPGPEKNCGPSS